MKQIKRVFLRADLNVPIKDKKVMQDYRLRSILPTINAIQTDGNKVILATHIGRPDASSRKNFFDENLSTKILVPWFEQHGYSIDYEIDLLKAIEKSNRNPEKILLLENLRFFNGEQQTNVEFAKLLAQLADSYVNDAFGLLHRSDTSITLLPQEFDPDHRSFGLLVKKELQTLTALKENPQQPFLIILGGNKGETKLRALDTLLGKPKQTRPETILIGGAIAQDFPENLLKKAKQNSVTVVLPVDTQKDNNKNIVDIGPKTIELFKKEIARAKTIFANGTMGICETKEHETGSREILQAVADSNATTIIGGGDAVAATFQFGLESKMSFLSTGGGATLAFLANANH